MAGYDGYSMSNNARAAYTNEEKPLSKWTKSELLDGIEGIKIQIQIFIQHRFTEDWFSNPI